MHCRYCNAEIGDFRFCSQCGADNGVADTTQQNYSEQYSNVTTYVEVSEESNDSERNKAIASMGLGICAVAGVGWFVTAILALVFSNQYFKSGSTGSEGFARAGKIMGTIGLVLSIVAAVILV